ncbi:DUF4982 domain-containing protein [Aerococcaceae bacterium DSM 111176]|nr:DUF4982 domain-containing protein [Aerococcaceae bacterium DSM 111176]
MEKYNLNIAWKFIKENIESAYQTDYNDASWEDVSLPHTYNDIDTFDNFMEGGHNGERSMYTGKTWYRKTFKIDKAQQDKIVLIEFEGVRQAAEVYINGKKLEGKSENGFIPFGYDLTSYLHYGEKENILAVMVDNSFPYYADGTDAILSWHDSHWHPTHGGIYRNVNLYIKDKLHVTLPLYSFLNTHGVYVYSQNLSKENVDIGIEIEVKNAYKEEKEFRIEFDIVDDNNVVIATMDQDQVIDSESLKVIKLNNQIQDPKLWSPEYPYLYSVIVKVILGSSIVDMSKFPLGIKETEFTFDQGFFINGNNLKLKGWGQRPTNEWAGLGTAFPDWMHTYIQDLMKEAGANFIRWGHSAGAPADIRASDRLGLLTIQPGVDGEGSTVGGVYSQDSYEVRIAAFRDLVIYFRNNPSIFVWEGGNQSVPDSEAQALLDITKRYDPFGGRAFAHRRSDLSMAKYVDVSIGTEGSWELKSKGKPIVEGEYNREEASRRVWDRYTKGFENYHTASNSAYDLTSEDLAKNQAKHFKKISDPAHSGGANWIFSDSTSHGRVYSEVARTSGVVDAVMLPKEAFHAIKSIYRNDPQIHILGHWNYPVDTTKDIYVMSNASSVELQVNGVSLGYGHRTDDFLFTFKNVEWEEGKITALGFDDANNIMCQQTKQTVGTPTSVKMTPILSNSGLLADGADVFHIDVEVVDEKGVRVPTYEGKVHFEFSGPVKWRGGYNSSKESSTNNTYLYLEAGINRVALRSTTDAGDIEVIAKIDGLQSASILVKSEPVPVDNGLAEFKEEQLVNELGISPELGEGPLENVNLGVQSNEETIIVDYSYSGINDVKGIRTNVSTGDQMYADEEEEFKFMPDYLIGSEYLLLPNSDSNYKALDLIHLSVVKDSSLFIAHDDSLIRPLWLTENFDETDGKLFVKGKEHTIFKQDLSADSTITLGGNADSEDVKSGNMYLVFVKEYDSNLVVKAPMY